MSELPPTVAVMAGINGAGKTSSVEPILRRTLRIPAFVNADTIARGLNAFDPEGEAVKAGRIMLEHIKDLAARRRSFAIETTLAARTYAGWLESLRASGYVVHLFYFWLDSPEAAINRVADRVRRGGHFIPDDIIRRRYSRSVNNFLRLYRPVVATWQVYDNTTDRPRLIAEHNSYFETVIAPDRWALFIRSAGDGESDNG